MEITGVKVCKRHAENEPPRGASPLEETVGGGLIILQDIRAIRDQHHRGSPSS